MRELLTKDVADDITETFEYDHTSDTVIVKREQDAQPVLDAVAAANVEGVSSIDGLGIPQAEVPIVVAIDFCARRGIPWEKFAYTNEYDDEWGRFLQNHPNLAYRPRIKYASVGNI